MIYKAKNYIIVTLFLLSFQAVVKGGDLNSLFEIAKFYDNKECAVSYTFDDGLLEHYTLVFPFFEELGIKGTFWINGNTIIEGEKGPVNDSERMSWGQMKLMSNNGHEISNHGWSHKNLTRCTEEEIIEELEKNDDIIEEKIGKRPVTFCYPYNAKNELVIELASKNRVGTRVSQFSMGGKSTPDNLDKRFSKLLENKEWGVAMIHGITKGYDRFKDDNILWNHLLEISKKKDQIWIATFKDVAKYTAQRDNIKLNVIKKGKKYKIEPIIDLDKNLFTHEMTLIINDNRKVEAIQNNKKLEIVKQDDKSYLNFNVNEGEILIKIK